MLFDCIWLSIVPDIRGARRQMTRSRTAECSEYDDVSIRGSICFRNIGNEKSEIFRLLNPKY
jgi:hypothetical protein